MLANGNSYGNSAASVGGNEKSLPSLWTKLLRVGPEEEAWV